ncbi:MAG: hypothetical protein HQL12_09035 [Candidatus Omnitrophica bacterium]|nr:hypothetical protein [Candidatus Omnitrophota bacterium]
MVGINVADPKEKDRIFQQYLRAFKKGVFNYIKEENDNITKQAVSRKYFSGGFDAALISPIIEEGRSSQVPLKLNNAEIIIADMAMFSGTNEKDRAATAVVDLKNKIYYSKAAHLIKNKLGGNRVSNFFIQLILFRNPIASEKKDFFVWERSKVLAYNLDSTEEIRTVVPMHKKFLNYQGPLLNFAYMKPGYQQPFHWHSIIPEYNFLVEGSTIKINENGKELRMEGSAGSLTYIPAQAIHTIENTTSTIARNLTLKYMFDNRNFSETKGKDINNGKSKILEGEYQKFNGGERKVFNVSTIRNTNYVIEIMTLNPGSKISMGPFKNKNSNFAEVVIPFSPTQILANDGENNYVLNENDNLLVYHNRGYVLINMSKTKAVLYRVVILKDKERLKKPLVSPSANLAMVAKWTVIPSSKNLATYGDYRNIFDVWMADLLKPSEKAHNPILLLSGDMGAGKTTISKFFKEFLEEHGHPAVVIHTDDFVDTRNFRFKLLTRSLMSDILYTNQEKRLRFIDKIYTNNQYRDAFWHQMESLKDTKNRDVQLVTPAEQVSIHNGTIIIFEGLHTKHLFPSLVPTKGVLFQIAPLLKIQRITNRLIGQGNSFLRANIQARLPWQQNLHGLFFEGALQYDYFINIDPDGKLTMSVPEGSSMDRDKMSLKNIKSVNAFESNDAAMNVRQTGGIDLTSANVSVANQNANDGIKFYIDPAQLVQLQNAPGFVPVIINIQPMTDLRKFLGIADNESASQIIF